MYTIEKLIFFWSTYLVSMKQKSLNLYNSNTAELKLVNCELMLGLHVLPCGLLFPKYFAIHFANFGLYVRPGTQRISQFAVSSILSRCNQLSCNVFICRVLSCLNNNILAQSLIVLHILVVSII